MGSLSMLPKNTDFYRETTKASKPLNLAMKNCAGPCRRRRSVAQFAEGDALCKICRSRA
jgi:hypothetical protein